MGNKDEIRAQYEFLRDTEELYTLFPSFSGDWEKDKTKFQKHYEINESFLKDGWLDLDDD